jgi:AraC-like DNA-binding protein
MKPASSYDDLLRAPVGRYLLARNLVLWCASPTLIGVVIGAEPQHDDVSLLLDLATRPLPPGLAANVDHLFDASRITRVDTDGFDTYLSGLAQSRATRPRMHRHAIVRPPGFVGAVVAGTHTLLSNDTPWSVFTSAGDALGWLGCNQPTLAAELDVLGAHITAGDPVLAQVRSMLRATQFRLSLGDASRQLGIGPRTLQRVLRKHATSFRLEVERERVAEAKRLLTETQLKLELIGQRAGYGSAAHFSTAFLQHTGVSPSKWRQRALAGITPLTPLVPSSPPPVAAPPRATAPTMHAAPHQKAC